MTENNPHSKYDAALGLYNTALNDNEIQTRTALV